MNEAKAFNQEGYTLLNIMRNLRISNSVGLIQHLQERKAQDQEPIAKLFKRFFTSELGSDAKVVVCNNAQNINKFFRTIDSSTIVAE